MIKTAILILGRSAAVSEGSAAAASNTRALFDCRGQRLFESAAAGFQHSLALKIDHARYYADYRNLPLEKEQLKLCRRQLVETGLLAGPFFMPSKSENSLPV